jgi:hypothetical protein
MARNFYGKTGIEIKDGLSDGLQSLATKARHVTEVAAYAGAVIVQRRAVELCPRSPGESGNGRDGSHIQDKIDIRIVQEPAGAYAKIGVFDVANNPYGPHLEFGDRGRPFMRPAIDETREEVHQEMRRVVAEELGSLPIRSQVRFKGTDARERG